VERVRAAIERRGVLGLAQESLTRAVHGVHRHEQHIWYDLRVADVPAVSSFDAPLQLCLASPDQLSLTEAVGRSALDARVWHGRGHHLWLVLDGATVAFACWIFRGRTPVHAARGGWLALPEDTVCLEHSITAPAYRGLGIAPRAWMQIANHLAGEGLATMITKVETDNVASRKAVGKAGFREIATQRFDRVGRRVSVSVEAIDTHRASALRDQLETARSWRGS